MMEAQPWIVTFTGRQFFPFEPQVDAIDIRDIAHSLSNICRFAGHTKFFYSVAQHSVIVSRMLIDDSEDDEQNRILRLAGLLHDAAEAYTFDCPSPILREFLKLKDMQDNILIKVAKRFNVPSELLFCRKVHNSDQRTLMTEKRDLTKSHPKQSWEGNFEPWKVRPIEPMSPDMAKAAFMEEYELLTSLNKILFEGS